MPKTSELSVGLPRTVSDLLPSTALGGSYDSLISSAEQKYKIPRGLLHGVIQQESSFNPNARSAAGALGLGQLMLDTAKGLGVIDPFDPGQNIDGSARCLAQQLKAFGGNSALALAAYNAGPGAVQKYGGVPPYKETQAYVKAIMTRLPGYKAPSASIAVEPWDSGAVQNLPKIVDTPAPTLGHIQPLSL
jgi:soluble lytic murein transglycosylase-like protein